MKQVNPYLSFRGQAEEAFDFYRSVFGGELLAKVRYRDMGMESADANGDLIAHISLPLTAETVLMGSDASGATADALRSGNNVEVYLAAEDAAEGQRLFDALAVGGTVTMPYERTAWAERFGSCIDRFGFHWVVDFTGEVQMGES